MHPIYYSSDKIQKLQSTYILYRKVEHYHFEKGTRKIFPAYPSIKWRE